MSAYRIRQSTPADIPALLEVWRRAVDATHHFLAADHRAAIDRMVAEEYLPNSELLVAVDAADRPIAFLGGSGEEIESLFVHPDVHGAGVGRQLVEHFARSASGELRVEVNEQNDGARAFYERLGFRVVGRSALDGQGLPYPLLKLAR